MYSPNSDSFESKCDCAGEVSVSQGTVSGNLDPWLCGVGEDSGLTIGSRLGAGYIRATVGENAKNSNITHIDF